MSIQIIKPGLCDTIQDAGRFGYQHLGINPAGMMDAFSAAIVNALVGKHQKAAVIESHFPAASFLLEQNCMLAIGGADFSPILNGKLIPLWQPVIAPAGSLLEFRRLMKGARMYLSFREAFNISPWLNSYSTNLKAGLGGFKGGMFRKKDRVHFTQAFDYARVITNKHRLLPWLANDRWEEDTDTDTIYVMQGPEYALLNQAARQQFNNTAFTITNQADRMGYLLKEPLPYSSTNEILSSATTFGSIQLLPGGKLIILMADHQVSGGYPRIAQVASAHLSKLAQKKPGETIRFSFVQQEMAETLLLKQQRHLLILQQSCNFKLEEWHLQ